ncbi:MAG: antitoxin [Actinomycetota bacterium]|nr:antitoxin [Actinomycetota bacterium]
MRSTITLEPDVRTLVERRMRERDESFKTVVNEALRAGLSGGTRRETPMPTFDMGEPTIDLDKALALAGAMEDEELIRRLQLRR